MTGTPPRAIVDQLLDRPDAKVLQWLAKEMHSQLCSRKHSNSYECTWAAEKLIHARSISTERDEMLWSSGAHATWLHKAATAVKRHEVDAERLLILLQLSGRIFKEFAA